jgi:hypothetical protein
MRFDLSGWDVTSGDRDMVLGTLKFHCKMTFAQRRFQYPAPDQLLSKELSEEWKLALASSFLGFALQRAETTRVPAIKPDHTRSASV